MKIRSLTGQFVVIGVFVSLLFGCSKFSTQYLEEKPFTDKITPFYYPKTIDSAAEIFTIDEAFRKHPLAKKDRSNFQKYTKIYFDEEFFPMKIENYRQDPFNNHVYYPYLIFKIEKREDKIAVSITEKTWQNNQLIASSVKMNFFDKEKEVTFDRVAEAFKRDPEISPYLNSILKMDFIADDSESNRAVQTQVASSSGEVYVKLTGKVAAYPDIKINVLFYDQNRAESVGMPIGQAIKIKVSLSKTSAQEGLNFTFISAELNQQQRDEVEKLIREKQGDNMYRSKTNE